MTEPDRQPKMTIRQLRQARGWTQEQPARRLGVQQAAVLQWERGYVVPRPTMQQRLADLFGVSVKDLVAAQAEQVPHSAPASLQDGTRQAHATEP